MLGLVGGTLQIRYPLLQGVYLLGNAHVLLLDPGSVLMRHATARVARRASASRLTLQAPEAAVSPAIAVGYTGLVIRYPDQPTERGGMLTISPRAAAISRSSRSGKHEEHGTRGNAGTQIARYAIDRPASPGASV